ncbi:transmembrane protein 268-like isoform X2 [Acanthaster planci]|uniref:Transmembrane protein 268-like isoform X2 n=1 Tax=Acanthaster planci TaxID=133434 RepID=A0A8B7XW66_ACAPL|nr:transmembrane protein 268-like isoform X2 [Acanthaster planci]
MHKQLIPLQRLYKRLLYTDDLGHSSSPLDDWEAEADQGEHIIRVRDDEEDEDDNTFRDSRSDNSSLQDEASRAARTPSTEGGIAPPLVGVESCHAFFCYSKEDEEWVVNVMQKLESPAYGFHCCNHAHELDPGIVRMDRIINALCTARKIVLVLSPDFVQSQWCTYENLKALRSHFRNVNKVIPVLLTEVDLPDFLQDIPNVNGMSKSFWQKFIAALQFDPYKGTLETSAHYNIPALYNGVELGQVSSMSECCCQARFDTVYCPDELARKGVMIPQTDYTSCINTILDSPKMRWHTLWYNRVFSVTLCICLSILIIVGLVGNLSDFGGEGAALPAGWAFLIGLVLSVVVSTLVHIITHLETVKLNTHIENHLAKANVNLTRHNVLVGMTDCFTCCWNRARLHFIYYDLRKCRATMYEFLTEKRKLQRGVNKDVTVSFDLQGGGDIHEGGDIDDTSRLTIDTRHRVMSPETLTAAAEPSSIQEEAELYLLQCSPAYVHNMIRGRLPRALRTLHCDHDMCLCQFTQLKIFNEEV